MGDDDRRKKSWREIDRQKDKSSHVERDGTSRSKTSERSSAKYKSELDKLFKGGQVPERFKEMMSGLEPEEGTPEAARKEAIQTLRDADGFREFARAVSEYREQKWAFPDDEELLLRMLDHPDERVVRDTLEHYADLGGRRELDRVGPLKNRLSTVETMSDDPRTRAAVDKVKEIL